MDINLAAALDFFADEIDAALQILDAGRRIVGRCQLQVSLATDAFLDITVLSPHVDDGGDAVVQHTLIAPRMMLTTAEQLRRDSA